MKNNNSKISTFVSLICILVLAQACSEHCADCSPDQSICFACSPGYQLSVTGNCILESTIPKCFLYGPTKSCFVCQPSFNLKQNKCVKDYSGCINFSSMDDNCFQCGFGTVLQNGKCTGTINCANSQPVCSKCTSGFSLKNGKCYPLEGCKNFDQSIGVCKQCNDSFDLIGYRCLPKGKKAYDCYVYNDKEQCQNCKNGYISYQNQCLLPLDIQNIQSGKQTMKDVINQKKRLYDLLINVVPQDNSKTIDNCQVINPQNKSQCVICVYGFYPTSDGGLACKKVSDLCDGHDVSNGNCFACKFGLTLNKGKCIDQNCQTYDGQNCKKCKEYFSLNSNGICIYSDSNCQIKDTKRCVKCLTNYKINTQGFCEINNQILKIENCKIVDQVNKICALCDDRFYRSKSQCLLVSQICKDYDMSNGKCKSCVNGYVFTNNECIKQTIQNQVKIQENKTNQNNQSNQNNNVNGGGGAITIINSQNNVSTEKDPNCLKIQSGRCTQCSNRFYVSPSDGKCIPVNPLCQNYDKSGYCTSCYKGYKISGQICIAAQQKDPYCKQVDSGNNCKSCFNGFFLNSIKSACQPLNPLCKSSDLNNGKCTNCYQGYTLTTQGTCRVFVRDPNCQQYDTSGNCLKCSIRFFIFQGICKQISPLCRESSKVTGDCTSCYPGYILSKGECMTATSLNNDINCQKRQNDACVSCYDGYYLNTNTKVCTVRNILCKTIFQNNGMCQTCYDGYVIQKGNCVIATQETANVHCKQTNPIDKRCNQCYQGYFISLTGQCKEVDPLCKKSDNTTGLCSDCYPGYNLVSNGKCVLASQDNTANNDPFCVKYQGRKCFQCNKGYFLSQNNICNQVDATCKTYSMINGSCLTCFQNFVLLGGKCIVGQQVYIPFCKQVNPQAKCIQCIDRYYLNKQSCSPVNLLCQGYDKLTGKCTSCISGYVLQNEQCIYPALGVDPLCIYYTNSYCTQCKMGYYLSNYFCTQIDKKCLQFNYQKSICTKCFNSNPQGALCV